MLVAPLPPSGPLSAPSGSLSAQQAGSQTGRLFATGRNFATGHMILLGAATYFEYVESSGRDPAPRSQERPRRKMVRFLLKTDEKLIFLS